MTSGPILPTDVLWFLSNPLGSFGYTGTCVPGASLGGYMSTTQVISGVMDNVFQDITGVQNAGQMTFYQCVFIMNNTQTGLEMLDPYVWMPTGDVIAGGANLFVGVDPTGVLPYETATQQAVLIQNANTAPAGVNTWYSNSASFTSGAPLANIPAQSVAAIWFKLVATNSPAVTPDGALAQVAFNSAVAP